MSAASCIAALACSLSSSVHAPFSSVIDACWFSTKGTSMIKRLLTITAALAVAVVTAAGGVAFAHSGTSRHHTAVHHKVAVHHRAARHAAVDGVSEAEEQGGEESASDGPGGHEDEPGSEVDH